MIYEKSISNPKISRLDSLEIDRWFAGSQEKIFLWEKVQIMKEYLPAFSWRRILKWKESNAWENEH